MCLAFLSFRPLIRGFFFYVQLYMYYNMSYTRRFRPLIRGFFFYNYPFHPILKRSDVQFPSPHSGILFLLSANSLSRHAI